MPYADSMTEQAAQTARASRGTHWRLNEKLSEGEIDLPGNLPIRMGLLGPLMKFTTRSSRSASQASQEKGIAFSYLL